MNDRTQALDEAPLPDLLAVLLRQFRRLLAERGVALTDAAIVTLAQEMGDRAPLSEPAVALRAALVSIVEESLQVLACWNLTFAQSLQTGMADMPGWETTAEFLDIANAKGNAELRIAAASALLAAMEDFRYGDDLLAAIAHEPHEIETVAGRQILSQASRVKPTASDWEVCVRSWLQQHSA